MKFNHQYIIEGATGPETMINGEKYLYFAGTGYFELNANSEMLKAASEATLKCGIATATTRAITGTSPLLVELEKKAAEFFSTEDAVYLPSGYLTDMAGI
ncbi:MAG: 8-amino-7-oxononanoate synthase, partial [Anaerolineales bacterium]